MQLIIEGVVAIRFNLAEELPAVVRLHKRYASVPMSLADACLVRMVELHTTSSILTLDTDFRVYRKSGRAVIPTLMPSELTRRVQSYAGHKVPHTRRASHG